ncbi:MAG: response regulator, partial [Deltaproteobacteria bacterium]|nr:response regulator [Deltaproteobacteria bacterium]
PIRMVLRRILEASGHEVHEASGGVDGLRLCRELGPDLVVTDLLMPDKSGLSVIASLVAESPGARIIALSGGGAGGKLNFLATARTFKGVRTLQKPFQARELMALVSEMLASTPEPR